ncbi:sugar ABC transporter ATP-binding protein [Rathayibacter sp. VKM Ac-2835]|uniref:sugar ABC transporter ATP-binding protein n=1 Tax=Rathayibacter sp. VKM Ac-2835 TaxID=2739043 RepID=UPI001563E7D8|nr:sugar ABC transporter ATP-binding protein [Rathayibacter sp. VKM Ac-2835]NRG43049.1 sugar ABC transporter ATP-binding protein [Rathayibacter sp. VKM Ac-2835]
MSATIGTTGESAASTASADPASLECINIEKGFSGIPVLKGVSLRLRPGTITALAGENGAGKSTLMKIASGQYRADTGEVLVRGEKLHAGDAQDAARLGVAIVPQELASLLDMAIYENIFIGRELRGPLGLRRGEMIARAKENLKTFGIDVDPTRKMRTLPVGLRQIVEIIKATNTGARAILLDEPSSAIAEREVARLVAVMRQLRDTGVALLFTTHKMEEIRQLADHIVVLRDGGLVMDKPMLEVTDDDIVTAMIGRELEDLFPDRPQHSDTTVLEVTDLQVEGAAEPVSFTVRRGEIIGLAGLVGAGRTELIEGIFGVRRTLSGTIAIDGRPLKRNNPSAAITANVALVPEDRKGSGGVLSMDILDNGSLPRLSSFTVGGWLQQGARRKAVREATESVKLRSRGLNQTMETLSGGNQQKVVFARWLTGDVDVLLLDEPTRGVDVGARSEIYRIITKLASEGMAVVMASSDMPEILSLAHRAFVLRAGRIVGELDRDDLAQPSVQDTIFRLASGLSDQLPAAADPTPTLSSQTDKDSAR